MWWDTIPLEDMTTEQWESLCDGCGRCCLIKAWDGDEIKMYPVACKLLDCSSGKCKNYIDRQQIVPDCIKDTPDNIDMPGLLPQTCAYKRIQKGQGLLWWHHLVSGSKDTVREAGISVIDIVHGNEDRIPISRFAEYMQKPILDDVG